MRSNAEPTITRYRNGFRCSGTPELKDGTTERFQAYAPTKEDALLRWTEKVNNRNYEIEYGERKRSGAISVYEACKGMIDDWESGIPRELVKEDKILTDASIKRLRVTLNYQIKPTKISKMLVKEVRPIDCDKWRDEVNRMKSRTGKLLSESTKQRAYALLDDTFDYFLKHENPMHRASKKGWHQKANTKTKNNVLQPQEIIKVETYCHDKILNPRTRQDRTYATMTLVMIYCYMRPGELYALQKRDWDEKRSVLHIRRTGEYADGRTKTKESIREFYVPRQAAELLRKRCERIGLNDRIFPALSGGIISDSAYRAWLLKMLQILEIKKENFSPHKLRGTGISYSIYLGVPAEVASQNAGHSNVATTFNWYKATYEDAKIAAVRSYEQALDNRAV